MKDTTKAIILLPTFLLIMFGVFYLHDNHPEYFKFLESPQPTQNTQEKPFVCGIPPQLSINYVNPKGRERNLLFEQTSTIIADGGEIVIYSKDNSTKIIFSRNNKILSCFNDFYLGDNLKPIYNDFKTVKTGLNQEQMNKYLENNNFFFVDNPNSQIVLNGDFNGKIDGSYGGLSSGFLLSSYSSGSIEGNVKGEVNLAGEIRTPISFISEDRFNDLVKENSKEFVKCYLLKENNAITTKEEPVSHLVCGIEKNNVYVASVIKSIEQNVLACKELSFTVAERENKDYPSLFLGEFKLLPTGLCEDIWGEKQ